VSARRVCPQATNGERTVSRSWRCRKQILRNELISSGLDAAISGSSAGFGIVSHNAGDVGALV